MLDGKSILITGGTGSFGTCFIKKIFENYRPERVIIYSRDEFKQYCVRKELEGLNGALRFFIGDVRDRKRLYRAFKNVDYVVHAAALKQVPSCEYNPFEAVKTNIDGAQNVVDAAIDRGVKKVVALSTDKAVNPINLYGATKLASDKIFISSNSYSGKNGTIFSVVRYGNVSGSRGSVIPFFRNLIKKGTEELPITDMSMTRFWITLEEAADLVFKAFEKSRGGETFVSKIPSYKITDLAKAIGGDKISLKEVGIREGEKLHEAMITEYDSMTTYEYDGYFTIFPQFRWWKPSGHLTNGGKKVEKFFRYTSDTNDTWLGVRELRERLKAIPQQK